MRRFLVLLLAIQLAHCDWAEDYGEPDVVLCLGPGELERHWIDTRNRTYGGSDFTHYWSDCGDDQFYCRNGPLLVSFPKSASTIPPEWIVDGYIVKYERTEYGFKLSTLASEPRHLSEYWSVLHFSPEGNLLRADYLYTDPEIVREWGNEYMYLCRGKLRFQDLFPYEDVSLATRSP